MFGSRESATYTHNYGFQKKEDKVKKGDIVKALDGSWSLAIGDHGKFYHPNIRNGDSELWEVLATNCKLPADKPIGLEKHTEFNDTILRSLDDGRILFSQACFLTFAHHCQTCLRCGQKV